MKIKITNLNKSIENIEILKNINLEIENNSLIGLIGKNGAGKSTLMKCIYQFYNDYKGKIDLEELTIDDIAFIMDDPIYFESLTVFEHLQLMGSLNKSESKITELIKQFSMEKYLNKFPNELSKGTLQRLSIIMILLKDFKLLLCDEPFAFLDPSEVKVLKRVLLELSNQGKIVLVSSHQLDILNDICTNFVFINDGKIVHNEINNLRNINELYDEKIV